MAIRYEVGSDIIVTGQNSEMSDMSNPRGDIHTEAFFVQATTTNGDRKRTALFLTRKDAEEYRDVAEKFFSLSGLSPWDLEPGAGCWYDADPQYGSDAYIRDEAAIVAREREEDMDW